MEINVYFSFIPQFSNSSKNQFYSQLLRVLEIIIMIGNLDSLFRIRDSETEFRVLESALLNISGIYPFYNAGLLNTHK